MTQRWIWFAWVAISACSAKDGSSPKIGSDEEDIMVDAAPPPPQCDETDVQFSASMTLSSSKHHVNAPKHVAMPPIGDDSIANCSTGFCGPFFKHGRTSAVKWKAHCVQNPNVAARVTVPCVAKVNFNPQDFLLYGNNTAEAGYHGHWNLWSYTCAFKDTGKLVGSTDCAVNGREDLKLVLDMTAWGDGVAYATGYAANHDNSSSPGIGVVVGYGPIGAFVTLSPGAGATYTKGGAWAQGMACDTDGKPYKLSNDGNGHNYPMAGSGAGNE